MSGLDLPPATSPVDDDIVDFAIELIERSGVATAAEAALAKTTGRRRSLPVAAVLVGLLCLAIDGRPLHLSLVTELLWRRISDAARAKLSVTGGATRRRALLARYRCVRYCFHALCSTIDPSPLPKNRCLDDAELAERTKPMSQAEGDAARRRLESTLNALLESSRSVLNDTEQAAYDGAVGLDATAMALWSRGPSKRTGRGASDPDGGWYVREGDHRDLEGPKGRTRTRIAWALEATIATMAPAAPGEAPTHPNLALGLALGRPGQDPGGTGTRVLASIADRGHRAGALGADRAYSCAVPERFHLPVAALGYRLLMDYRVDQLGIQANTGGAIMVEGTWCCPAMPDALVKATIDYRAGAIDEPTWRQRIAARAAYHLKRKDGPDADGYERRACPATGHHSGLMCPLRPSSMSPLDGRTKVLTPPADPPKICCQSAITIAPDVGARHRQHLAFGTEEWARQYATLRNTIEGLNGYLKDPAHQALAEAARRRVRGIAPQSIFCALLLVAANLRKIRAWRALVAEGTTERIARRARRRRIRLGDYAPSS